MNSLSTIIVDDVEEDVQTFFAQTFRVNELTPPSEDALHVFQFCKPGSSQIEPFNLPDFGLARFFVAIYAQVVGDDRFTYPPFTPSGAEDFLRDLFAVFDKHFPEVSTQERL